MSVELSAGTESECAMIVISEFMDQTAVAELSERIEARYDPELADRRDELISLMPRAEALIVRNRTIVDETLVKASPKLRCVGRLGVGLDNIDLKACAERRVAVYPATGANDRSVAEFVIASAMLLLRKACFRKDEVLAGNWPREQSVGREIAGKTIGLIGFGSTGKETGRIAAALGLTVLACDPCFAADAEAKQIAQHAELNELLAASDIVSLHVPLAPETKGIMNREKISAMRPRAILINAARGGVLDENAAVAALMSGKLGGLALDVFETEPLTREAAGKFAGIPNLLLTPHIGGVTEESNVRVSAAVAQKVAAHLSNSP